MRKPADLTKPAYFLTLVAMTTNNTHNVSGYLSIAYFGLLTDYLGEHGLDAAGLPGGETLRQLAAGDTPVMPVRAWREVLEAAAERLRQPDLGLRLGQRFTPAHLGLLGYVLQSCGTVGAALERLQHYERLINGINRLRRREVTDDHGLPCTDLVWGVEHGRPGQQVDSCNIATLLQVTRRMTGLDAGPLRIDFVNPAPADLAPYIAFFRCPLHFDQPETRVRLPSAWLDVPLPNPDPQLAGLLQRQVDALLAQLPDEADIVQAVRRSLARHLRRQSAGLDDIAADLNLSPRTLHRRLEEAGTSYRALWEDTRRHLAEEYLLDPHLTLNDIAGLLGFSEQSALTRAFRRWHGVGPKAWRRQSAAHQASGFISRSSGFISRS